MEFEFWVHKDMFFGKSSVYCTDTAILYWDRLNFQQWNLLSMKQPGKKKSI